MKRIEQIKLEDEQVFTNEGWKDPEVLISQLIVIRKLNELIEAINDLYDNQEKGHR